MKYLNTKGLESNHCLKTLSYRGITSKGRTWNMDMKHEFRR